MTVVCVLKDSGGKAPFTPIWVTRLRRQVIEHLRPSRFLCLTDMDVTDCETVPLYEGYPGWWSKICAFRPGLCHGPTMLIDLDSLILRPLPGIGDHVHRLMMLSDLYAPNRPASGMMLWRPSPATERIYEEFRRDPKAGMATRHGDGGFIGQWPHDRIQKAWPGMVGSYKGNRLQNGPGGFAVCAFHGTPKFNDLPTTSWAVKAWVGSDAPNTTVSNPATGETRVSP